MRSKKAIINTIMSLLEELVSVICSFILPHFILSYFGSTYNGLTSSITQFLSCAFLLRLGIGGATNAALYKPLADNNQNEINSIIKATDIYMKKVSAILLLLIVIFAAIYPVFVSSEFGWFFTFSLFMIIGISTFAESLFGVTYRIVLQADQRLYISSIIRIICNLLNVILSVILIVISQSIHIVKIGSTLAFSLYPIIISLYVKKKYKINKNVKPNYKAIEQRWDSLWHQLATFVNENTDIMILTIFTNMSVVSVYSVYNMVISGLKKFITSFTNGIDAAFGNMIARNELKALNKNFSIIELIVYNLSTLFYSCALFLILQFVKIYTDGITDVNYLRPIFAYILLIAQFLYSIRLSYQILIQASGQFRQTKKYSIWEALLNILISIILVAKYGLIGVAVGTFVALLYKTITLSNYVSDNIIKRKKIITLKKSLISFGEMVLIIILLNIINLPMRTNYLSFALNGIISIIVSCTVIFIGTIIFYKQDYENLLEILKSNFIRKVEKKHNFF